MLLLPLLFTSCQPPPQTLLHPLGQWTATRLGPTQPRGQGEAWKDEPARRRGDGSGSGPLSPNLLLPASCTEEGGW